MQIKSVSIKNFRSIENQTIENISEALILIGKNNSGKSSVISSIRAFFNQYHIQLKDFPAGVDEIEIVVTFYIEEDYFINHIFDQKLGILKFPSNAKDFEYLKVDSNFSDMNYSLYKELRENAIHQDLDEYFFYKEYTDIYKIWLKCIKDKCIIEDNLLTVHAKIQKDSLRVTYYNKKGEEIKYITSLFPEISYIHDERNFSEEEVGKSNTLTSDLFVNKILNNHSESKRCSDCHKESCKGCYNSIKDKKGGDLTTDDLEKLVQIKFKKISEEVSCTISEFFQENYLENYNVMIDPQCNINKSVSGIITKIYDPNIQKELHLSNVGAGLRNIYNLSLLQAYDKLYENNSANTKIIYILEEPEIYLHPSLQKKMCSIIHDISQKSQVFFTTHSPLLLKHFDPTQIRKTSLDKRFKTKISNTDLTEILDEIGYSTADLLQTDYIIICEGREDSERLKLIIDKFYNIEDISNISFIEAKGCSNIGTYATLKFLNKTYLKDKFVIIRDSDTEDPDMIINKLSNKYKENLGLQYQSIAKERILVLKYSALECYFLDPDILKKLGINDPATRIINYVDENQDSIKRYIHDHNKEDRASRLIEAVYETEEQQSRMENIFKNVRGHDLFGIFGPQLKENLDTYVRNSTKNNFRDLLSFLDKFYYFKEKSVNQSHIEDFR